MIALLARLQPREARSVALGAALALVLLGWLFVLEPLAARLARAQAGLAAERALDRHLEAIAARIDALPAAAAPSPSADTLLGLVDTSSRDAGLREQVRRVAPEGDGTVRVWLEDVPFETLMGWLLDLQRGHGVAVPGARIAAGQVPGRVQAQLTLAPRGG